MLLCVCRTVLSEQQHTSSVLQHNFNKNISSAPWPSCNISTVLCRAVSGMPPTPWRWVGIHQHTGKWEWALNNRTLTHCHSVRSVGRRCLESALLVSRTQKKKRKNSIPVHGIIEKLLLDSSFALLCFCFVLLCFIQQHETFRFGSSCQCCSPYSLHYGTSNMIQLTASLELTSNRRGSVPRRVSECRSLTVKVKRQIAVFLQLLICGEHSKLYSG